MYLHEKEINFPLVENNKDLLDYFSTVILKKLPSNEMPVRFVVTRTDDKGYHCELGILSGTDSYQVPPRNSIFDFRKRTCENAEQFNAVLIVPTINSVPSNINIFKGDGSETIIFKRDVDVIIP